MTKIIKKNKSIDISTHINKSYDIINAFLPKRYVPLVQTKFKEQPPSSQLIRNVRCRYKEYHINNIEIVSALVEVAQEQELKVKKLKQLIK